MKRLFTFAIVGMLATSLAFAQSKVAKGSHQFEKVPTVATLNNVKQTRAAQLEKANAEQTTATSVLRHSAATAKNHNFPSVKGNVLTEGSFSLRNLLNGTPTSLAAAPLKIDTQVGNVTITTDSHGIITDVTGVEPKLYQRATTGLAFFRTSSDLSYAQQSGLVEIVEDGDNVYIKNPVTRYATDTWIKGTKSGNTISFAYAQPLYYDSDYATTISLRWCALAGTSLSVDNSYTEPIIFTVDGDVLTLEGSQAWDGTNDTRLISALYDDDDYFMAGDAATVLTYTPDYEAPSTDLVELPAGATVEDWVLNGTNVTNSGEKPVRNQAVKVAFVGTDVYVQGAFEAFPTAWIKGTIEGSAVTFSNFQYVGTYSSYDIWMIGVDAAENICDAKATYDAAAKTITFSTSILANADAFRIYYLQWIKDAVLSGEVAEIEEPIITDLTATLPYVNTFDTEAEADEVAMYDTNEDGKTFTIETDSKSGSKAARYQYNSSKAADDLLVFPGLPLKAGASYKVAVDARAQSAYYAERLEILCAKVAKASQFTTVVVGPTDLEEAEYVTVANNDFTVAEDGTYFFAIHAISDADCYYLWVDNFSVKENNSAAPVAVADLAVEADATGANKATVTFTVPAKDLAGNTLTNELNVTVKRGAEVIKEEAKLGGSIVTIEDEVPAPGEYTYTVVVANGDAVSDPASVKAWVGVDIPGAVENLTAADKSTAVALAWDAPTTGENGGVVIVDELTYNVYPVEMIEFFGMLFPETDYDNPYFTGLTETNASVAFNTNEGEQGFTYFAVSAESAAGEGEDIYAAVLTGAPWSLPVKETVANESLDYWWGVSMNVTGDDDGAYLGDDEGSLMLYATTPGYVALQSGKIALEGASNPVVTFDAYALNGSKLEVVVVTPAGETVAKTINLGDDYESYNISLVPFANEDWVRVFFKGIFTEEDAITIKDIKIFNQLDNNLSAQGITAPAKVNAGDDINVKVAIENQGADAVGEGFYTVELFVNGEKAQTVEGPALVADAKTTVNFTIETSVLSPETMEIYANIYFAMDDDDSDNTTATKTVKIALPKYPTVEDLTETVGENGVELTWSKPNTESAAPEQVTEDFEDAESFAQEFGDWTFIDNDGLAAGGIQNVDIPGVVTGSTPLAWFVMDTEVLNNEAATAHSGTKYMATMFNYEGGANDDWMISPELYGGAQTVSFFAKSYVDNYGLETIEILYTTGSMTDLNGYVSLMVDDVPAAEWTEYSVNLPEGAKYFAIRYISQDVFTVFVDDITFIPAGAGADLELLGYNVYRNGVQINAELVEETSYLDAEGTAEDKYVVTAVYAQGESAPSTEVGGTTGIQSAFNATGVKVQDRTIVVKAEGNVAIYTADGKAIYNAAGNANVAVVPGVYVVKYGNKTAKVMVK